MKRRESVLLGRDPEALSILLDLHAVHEPRILDATCNKGRMWQGTGYRPLRMDIDPAHRPDVCADFTRMPFADASFDVIVFDPPHMARWTPGTRSAKNYQKDYGLKPFSNGIFNISGIFRPFLREARRVLNQDGVILAKLIDHVNNHCYQWQHVDFVNAVKEEGMTPCDLLLKREPSAGTLMSGKWKRVHHLRRSHTYWFVVRKGSRCERSRNAQGAGPVSLPIPEREKMLWD